MIEKKLIFHNININIITDKNVFLEYVTDYIDNGNIPIQNEEYELSINYLKSNNLSDFISSNYIKIGTELYKKNNNEFIIHTGHNLWLKVKIDEKHVAVTVFDKLNKLKTLLGLLIHGTSYTYQRYMFIIRQALLLPSFYLYYKYYQYVTWHTSALNIYGKNIAFSGLNGSGKSGLLFYFLNKNKSSKIITDNYLLINSNAEFLSVPEPVRIEEGSEKNNYFFEKKICEAFGKVQFKPKKEHLTFQGKLDIMFSVELGPKFAIEKINSEEFNTRMSMLHSFLSETPEHSFFEPISYFNDKTILKDVWKGISKSFCDNVECYNITIPYEKDITKRYIEVQKHIKIILKDLK